MMISNVRFGAQLALIPPGSIVTVVLALGLPWCVHSPSTLVQKTGQVSGIEPAGVVWTFFRRRPLNALVPQSSPSPLRHSSR